jgi:transcriptional regulator with XRE-family HTH domain
MPKRPHSFVRACRRRWGLTQEELAMLLGVESSTTVSRIERSVRTPTAAVLVACSILFGLSHAELFPSLYEAVEEGVANAAKTLYDQLGEQTDSSSLRKREFVEALFLRIGSAQTASEI